MTRFLTPTDRAAEHEIVLLLRQNRSPKQSREDRNVHDSHRDHDLPEPRPQHRDDADREEQARDRKHDVHCAHDHRVDQPARVTGDRAEQKPIERPIATETTPMRSEKRAAVDDPRELVTAEQVDSNRWPELGPTGLPALSKLRVLLLRPVGRDHRREDRARHEDRDEEGAEDRAGLRMSRYRASLHSPDGPSSWISRPSISRTTSAVRMRGLMIA